MSDRAKSPNPYDAPATAARPQQDADGSGRTFDRSPVLHRAVGAAVLALAGGLAYLTFVVGVLSLKLLTVVPLCAATGVWMLVFGQPRRPDGMTPAWWRLGLLVVAVTFLLLTLQFVR
jgi:hypothetical protein